MGAPRVPLRDAVRKLPPQPPISVYVGAPAQCWARRPLAGARAGVAARFGARIRGTATSRAATARLAGATLRACSRD
jgi:hypothetical protein